MKHLMLFMYIMFESAIFLRMYGILTVDVRAAIKILYHLLVHIHVRVYHTCM